MCKIQSSINHKKKQPFYGWPEEYLSLSLSLSLSLYIYIYIYGFFAEGVNGANVLKCDFFDANHI